MLAGSLHIADVRLIDGSKDPRNSATEPVYASLPVTFFFEPPAVFASFKEHVGRTPLLFTCLDGKKTQGKPVSVSLVKKMSRWTPALGPKAEVMAAQREKFIAGCKC